MSDFIAYSEKEKVDPRYGLEAFYLTDEDIENLKKGKKLYTAITDNEYGVVFIVLRYRKDENRPKGHWIKMPIGFKCSECNELEDRTTKFCPNCGAIMVETQERSDIEENMTEVESQERNLCDSCKTKGCIFQYGIVRSHCDFYKAESEDKE